MQNTRLASLPRGRVKPDHFWLFLIVLLAFAFRLLLLPHILNPGLHDPVHYFNLGRRLAQGEGFSIDYVWHYAQAPTEIEHPIDHWMPLAGLAVAVGLLAGDQTLGAGLTVFVLAGALLPLVVFLAVGQLRRPVSCALFAAVLAAFTPELVLNSLRSDTTILNALLLCGSVLLFNHARESQRSRHFVFSGLCLGLAYLTRSDSILLLPILVLLRLGIRGRRPVAGALLDCLLLCLAFAAVVAPWLWRNFGELGALSSAQTGLVPFMVEHNDVYSYGIPITLESMLERQNLTDLAGKRFFELAAALRQSVDSLGVPLAALAVAGLALLPRDGDRRGARMALPLLLWLLAILLIYPLLLPIYNQGGSFKKAFLSAAPLLLPYCALAVWRLVADPRLRWLIALVVTLWLCWSSVALVRREAAFADTYHQSIGVLLDTLAELPDVDGDGEIRLMSQDPYVLSYYGYASIMTPHASRERTLELARKYGIDYLMLPAGRPTLDPLYLGAERDPRFALAAHIADAGAKPWELYRLHHDG